MTAAVILTIIFRRLAYKERGYEAIGGEYFPMFTIPFALMICEKREKEIKEINERTEEE